jgi:hypothetical protein
MLIISLVSGIILASLSGAAYLAIKYHDLYKSILEKTYNYIFVTFMCFMSFISGHVAGALFPDFLNIKTMFHLYSSLSLAMVVAIFGYLHLLDNIGRKISKNENQKQK